VDRSEGVMPIPEAREVDLFSLYERAEVEGAGDMRCSHCGELAIGRGVGAVICEVTGVEG